MALLRSRALNKTLKNADVKELMPKLLKDLRNMPGEFDSLALRAEALRTAAAGEAGSKLKTHEKNLLLLSLYAIREWDQSKAELAPLLEQQPLFKAVGIDNVWRMLIDHGSADRAAHEGLRFENESGYMAGMHRGLAVLLKAQQENKALDGGLVFELHDTATAGVFECNYFSRAVDKETPFHSSKLEDLTAPDPAARQLTMKQIGNNVFLQPRLLGHAAKFVAPIGRSLTKEGLTEALQRISMRGEQTDFHIFRTDENGQRQAVQLPLGPVNPGDSFIFTTKFVKQVRDTKRTIERILDEYRTHAVRALNDEDKLMAIGTCCQDLAQAHPFPDGNARTFGYLVINKLLLEAGLPLAAMDDPKDLDGLSRKQVVGEIKKAQENFAALAQQP